MKLIYEKTVNVKSPQFSLGNAGIDFFVPDTIKYVHYDDILYKDGAEKESEERIFLKIGDSVKIKSGIKLDIPEGYAVDLVNKSGISLSGLTIGAELIDSSYTGEISYHLIAHRPVYIEPGQKIVQGIIIEDNISKFSIEEGEVNKETERGSGGFGSTGIK